MTKFNQIFQRFMNYIYVNKLKVIFILHYQVCEMKEQLLNKNDKNDKNLDNVNIRTINYSIFFLVLLACGYSFLFITMTMNTSSMNNNLNKIIDVINKIDLHNLHNLNTTIEPIHTNLSLITECVLHKYCKRVPS